MPRAPLPAPDLDAISHLVCARAGLQEHAAGAQLPGPRAARLAWHAAARRAEVPGSQHGRLHLRGYHPRAQQGG
eukprot:2844486-Prymnesium_polylepis.1